MHIAHYARAALMLATLLPAPSLAQELEHLSLNVDNDSFALWRPLEERTDFEYTHGTRVAAELRSSWPWRRLLAPGLLPCGHHRNRQVPVAPCLSTSWELGQQIYTARVVSPERLEGDRPYAGWLYAAMTANVLDERTRQSLRLELGVTGQPSLAGKVQRLVHQLGGYWTPDGWDHQLAFEPGLLLRYEVAQSHRAAVWRTLQAELTPELGLSVGNVITGADAGATARFGFALPHPWLPPRRAVSRPFSIQLTGGVLGRWTLRNLFLDGNTGRDGPRVEKLPLLGEHSVGAALAYHHLQLGFAQVTRGREYRTEPGGHQYHTITLTYRH